MKVPKTFLVILFQVLIVLICGCQNQKSESLVPKDKIYAWCIVPYDSLNRTPVERIKMLKELGIDKYAYDWRNDDQKDTKQELLLAKENNITVKSLWMWIDSQWDTINKLNPSNEKIFNIIEEANYKGQIWVSFHSNYFENLTDSLAVDKGVEMISYLNNRAKKLDCSLALYNHGDWFGEPKNQIKIIKELPEANIGLVYNFHHAHHQVDAFPTLLEDMLPYLQAVNLSGIKKGGPKILPIGQGHHELEMLKLLQAKGYAGEYGILGHVEDADVKEVLKENLKGLHIH